MSDSGDNFNLCSVFSHAKTAGKPGQTNVDILAHLLIGSRNWYRIKKDPAKTRHFYKWYTGRCLWSLQTEIKRR